MTAQLVRYKSGKHSFELMVKPGTVAKFRKGELGVNDVLETDVIFSNQSKGDRANAADLSAAFETDDNNACIKLILEKGDVQLTAAERKEKIDKRKREIVNYIHKYYVDPRNKLPHPVVRIESAIDEIKFRVDGDAPAERQAMDLIKKLPSVLPIKKCEIIGKLAVPHKHMGSIGGVLSQYVKVTNEKWDNEGCKMEVSLVPGDYDHLVADLHKITKGEYQFEIEGAGGEVAAPAEASSGRGKGKKKPARGGVNRK